MCFIPAIHLYKVGCLSKKKQDLCVDLKTTIDELDNGLVDSLKGIPKIAIIEFK